MMKKNDFRQLQPEEIKTLEQNRCTCSDWSAVKVAEGFGPASILNSHFMGNVTIGEISGSIESLGGIEKPCGIYNATIIDCCIGNNARISNVGVHIANYDIEDGVCIEDIGTMQTNPGATFGNGIEAEVLNEGGGREVILFDELNAQFAYIMCLHRHRPKLIEKLNAIAKQYVATVKSDRGTIGKGAKIRSTKEIIDVRTGDGAIINGAASLVNGTILSNADEPVKIGAGVIGHDFIISECSSVSSQAILEKVFIGQGCQIGEQFSAAHSVFFANSEGFHGEVCSIFGGPYTVTHHKSSLLIAGLFSFYNAGSGTNQSNHMYKLGPVHEGKLQRGTKTGSFSYMMWPCRVGPFSVVLGKHTSTFDTEDFPFSHLDARPNGKCSMVPGLHLTTVGTVRDGAKWPKRDRRKNSKRDIITFDVFSPYTIGKMLKANARLKELHENTDKSIEEVSVGGALVRRPILRSSQKYYRNGIEMYLLEKVIEKYEGSGANGDNISQAFATSPEAVHCDRWVDISGQLMTAQRMDEFEDKIEAGEITDAEQFHKQLEQINDNYANDEWAWVKAKYKDYFGVDLDSVTKNDVIETADKYLKIKSKFLNMVIADAEKEFSELSHTGFGQDGKPEDVQNDFAGVRGIYKENSFVKEMRETVADKGK